MGVDCLISPMVEQSIVNEGWLYKRGGYLKTWRRRYFVLRSDGAFLGFKSQPEPGQYREASHNFTVEGCQVMCQRKPRPFTFIVRGLRRTRQIERAFSVGSLKERTRWVEAIDLVKENLREAVSASSEFSSLSETASAGTPMDNRRPARKVSLDDFELVTHLGRGSFGKVILSREISSNELYAIKIVKKQAITVKEDALQAVSETHVLRSLRHPFVIGLKYSFQTAYHLCYVLEYAQGGELFAHLLSELVFSAEKARFYGAEIVLALEFLHQQGIIHRDLKLQNILLDRDGHVKITDFGLCKQGMETGSTTKTMCGTPSYMAPEIVTGSSYGFAADWWSFGVVMFQMLCGTMPFESNNRESLYKMIAESKVKIPSELSSEEKSLLRRLLERDPKKRLGGRKRAAEDIKKHAFFRGVEWSQVLAKESTPPLRPRFASDADTRYFDPRHTQERAQLTPIHRRRADAKSIVWEQLEKQYYDTFSFYG